MEMYRMWHEASVVEMRENHNVMVFKELLMAGDVELNPGPYPPELLARLMNDFAELKPKFDSLGIQLNVPVYIIEEIKSDTGDRLSKIFDHWLHNTQEDLWFKQLHTALQQMKRSDLAIIVEQKYMRKSSEDSFLPGNGGSAAQPHLKQNLARPDFSISNLTLLKYTDSDGQPKRIKLKDELSIKWHAMGDLLGISPARLNTVSGDPIECCRKVLGMWFELGGGKYALSWEGLMELLEDLELIQALKDLKIALYQ